ncbi:MAG: uracil-xanthine permease family protein, partial [Shewanella oncorhynchi]
MRRLAIPLQGAQMLFVAFGALVLMPLLTGLDTSVALFTAGIGTLLFQLITKRQVPIFLASSFAFIAPILYGVQTWGIPSTMGGIMAAGVVYVMLGALVKVRGTDFIHRLLPPVVVGPVIIIIGLGLAPVAVNMALGKSGDGSLTLVATNTALFISLASLGTTIAVAIFAKGLLKVMPILAGIIVGYSLSLAFGIVDFAVVTAASWIAIPKFVAPELNWYAIAFMIPVAIAPAVEHIGDILAISNVTGKDFMKKPGLHRT